VTTWTRHNFLVSARTLLVVQCCTILFSLAFLLLAPTGSRPMMFIPISAYGQGEVARLATAKDRKLLGGGTIPGSLVVRGNSLNPVMALFERGVLVVSVSYSSCSSGAE
jgi:hypothetical protein